MVIAAAAAERSLPLALEAIEGQDYQGDIEVVVAAADPETARAVDGLSVVLIHNQTGRTAAGLNLAANASSGEVLIRVDAHSIIPPHYVRTVVETLDATGADNVGGRQVPIGSGLVQKAIAEAMSSPFGTGNARYRVGGPPGPSDTVYLGSYRRAVFERLGGYDERFLRNQDYELNHRIRAAGGTVWFEPSLEVEYRPRPSLPALASQYFQYGRWKRFFARSHNWSLRPRQWVPPILVLVLALSLLASIWSLWLLAIPAAYLLALVAIGLISARRIGVSALLVPAALAVMHLSWGIGFLLGHTKEP